MTTFIQSYSQLFDWPPLLVDCLRSAALGIIQSREPDFIVGGRDRPYMLRWWMKRSDDGGAYIHRFLRDDDDRALHDHPWCSLSVLLAGSVTEVFAPSMTDPRETETHRRRDLEEGAVVYRDQHWSHRLELRSVEALTLFIVGSRSRDWGFWCPQGWRDWREFTAPADTGQIGRGCDA